MPQLELLLGSLFLYACAMGGVAAVFVVSSAKDGCGTRPGMADSNDIDSSHSLDLALPLEPIQTEGLLGAPSS